MNNKRNNAGFSLIEMMIVIAVMAVMGSALFLGPEVFRRREVDKFAKELCFQIQQMQTLSMTKSGQWRLAFYEQEGGYYCVQEKKEASAETSEATWNAMSGQTELGRVGAVSYRKMENSKAAAQEPLFVWRFNRDTGACTEGAGTYELSGYGEVKRFKVYEGSGRCERVALP